MQNIITVHVAFIHRLPLACNASTTADRRPSLLGASSQSDEAVLTGVSPLFGSAIHRSSYAVTRFELKNSQQRKMSFIPPRFKRDMSCSNKNKATKELAVAVD